MPDRVMAAQQSWRTRTFRPLWSWQEERVVDRYASALTQGEYRTAAAAARVCQHDLELLRAKHPDAPWAQSPRTYFGVRTQITSKAHALGGHWACCPLWPFERRLMRRYADAFLAGRYQSVKQAARACHQELLRLEPKYAGAVRLTVRRPFHGVYTQLREWAQGQGWSNPSGYWSPQERRITARYARGVIAGRYHNATEASRECVQFLDRLRRARPDARWLARRRTELSVYRAICDQARALGKFGTQPDWSAPELRLVDRFARRVVDGRCPTVTQAVLAFMREIGRLRQQHSPPGWLRVRRTRRAAARKMNERARALGRPAIHVAWTPYEERVLNRHVQALVRGRYGTRAAAAFACTREFARLHRERPADVNRRTRQSVIGAIRKRTSAVGPASPREWSRAELAVCDRWADWYDRRHRERPSRALGEAAARLKRDLDATGSRRSYTACLRLILRRRRNRREQK